MMFGFVHARYSVQEYSALDIWSGSMVRSFMLCIISSAGIVLLVFWLVAPFGDSVIGWYGGR